MLGLCFKLMESDPIYSLLLLEGETQVLAGALGHKWLKMAVDAWV
jgi:hypothetical protein